MINVQSALANRQTHQMSLSFFDWLLSRLYTPVHTFHDVKFPSLFQSWDRNKAIDNTIVFRYITLPVPSNKTQHTGDTPVLLEPWLVKLNTWKIREEKYWCKCVLKSTVTSQSLFCLYFVLQFMMESKNAYSLCYSTCRAVHENTSLTKLLTSFCNIRLL